MRRIIFVLFVFIAFYATSQNFEYEFLFEGIGDNREYFSGVATSQTIFGSRTAFEIGVETDNHRFRGGISHLFEFGSNIDFHKPKLTLYYQFKDNQKNFLFGAFPRRNKIDFPLAMLTDTLLYFRPNIEGLFGEINWSWGKQNAFVDWTNRQTEVKREKFMVGFSGEIFHKNIFLQNYILLFHDAFSAIKLQGQNIKDYLGFAVQAGVRTKPNSKIQGHFKAGVLSSSFRERNITDGFINSIGLLAEVSGKYKNYGIKSVLSTGGSHKFALGDRFYLGENYWRTDVIWYFINHKNVKGRFNLSFHLIDGKDLDQQQQLSVIYVFNNKKY